MLLVGFSVTASAKSIDVPDFYVQVNWNWLNDTKATGQKSFEFYPRDGARQYAIDYANPPGNIYRGDNTNPITSTISYSFIPKNETSYLFNTDGEVTFKIKYAYLEHMIRINSVDKYYNVPDSYRFLLHYSDGTMKYIDNVTFGYTNREYSATFTPKKNVVKLELITKKEFKVDVGALYMLCAYIGEIDTVGDNANEITIQVETEEVGLLKGIIEWLKGIKDGITNVFNSIAELPSKIWSFIENGLKSLFVPDEEFITDYRDRMDLMLEEKLGAVYQFANITFDGWDRITANDQNNTIEFPSATIHLGDTDFTFGGYTVKIVPDGFEFIVTIIKTIIGILCTLAFVNGMRKRYDDVMGGGST